MADNKRGRVAQAHNAERRQLEREIEEARSRIDESEPTSDDDVDAYQLCHRSDCERTAMFYVVERYLDGADDGVVEESANLCRRHSAEEGPIHLDGVYDNYVFRIEPLTELRDIDGV